MMRTAQTTRKPMQPRLPVGSADRSGFTLVEMLVAIALVMLMMLMFAQIFEQAAGSISRQKGMAKNDQNARTITTLMREDLANRTFRDIIPYFPGQDTTRGDVQFNAQKRKGYFSISENDADDDTDDVLAFTVDISANLLGTARPYTGRATMLERLRLIDNPPGNPGNHNQPEFDDGDIANNFLGTSRFAEVVYFLRNGNLYRRVMLIRDPYDDEGQDPRVQPNELNKPILNGNYVSEVDANNNSRLDPSEDTSFNNRVWNTIFWRDFDYSAYREYAGANPGVFFHDSQSALIIQNPPASIGPSGHPVSLGIPHYRFGHSVNRANGTPRERAGGIFIGRFTMQETAHTNFGYPGVGTTALDPHTRTLNDVEQPDGTPIPDGIIDEYDDEIFRRGEDILLTDVHGFDVKVWDDYRERDLDGDGLEFEADTNGNGILDPSEDTDGNGIFDIEDFNNNGQQDQVLSFVDLGHNLTAAGAPIGFYNRTDFTSGSLTGLPGLGQQAASTFGNRYDTWHPYDDDDVPTTPPPHGYPSYRPYIGFRTPPPPTGNNFGLGNDELREIPLRAIQITIRYYDASSDQVRQLTLVHSLVD